MTTAFNIVSILLSVGLVSLSITAWMTTRWLSRLSQRVLDLEYPLQAQARVNIREKRDGR